MSRLTCRDTLLDRISKPGMIGALGKVGSGSIQTTCTRWRNGRGCPSKNMLERLAPLVAAAEEYLKVNAKRATVLEERRQMLRKILRCLPHGSNKQAEITLQTVADAAGMERQLLTNFRCGDRPMGMDKVDRLEKAMKQLKLIPNEN